MGCILNHPLKRQIKLRMFLSVVQWGKEGVGRGTSTLFSSLLALHCLKSTSSWSPFRRLNWIYMAGGRMGCNGYQRSGEESKIFELPSIIRATTSYSWWLQAGICFQSVLGATARFWGSARRHGALYPLGHQFKSRSFLAWSTNGNWLGTDFPS